MSPEETSSLPRFTPLSCDEAAGSCTVGTEAVVSCVDPEVVVTATVPDPDPDAAPDPAPDPDADPDADPEADADAAGAADGTPTGADGGRDFCSFQ